MNTKKPAIIMLALLAVLAAPTLAGAYCVYNRSDIVMYVKGGGCAGCLETTINKGSKACCPGDKEGCRGHHSITFSVFYPGNMTCGTFYVPKDVEAHGWVSFFGSCRKEWKTCLRPDACDKLRAKVHDKDGNVTYEGGVKPTE